MKANIYIPKKINVGFQNRIGTYTGRLAYVIYTDEKGILRKQKSWDNWRDKGIEPEEFDNEPTEGFVLNKKTGDYSNSWGHRQAYCRVYDPRNFEFEITIENLLYILENTNSIVGKGLEGQFVYGWDKTDLVLIPCSSPDYKEMVNFAELVSESKKFGAKDLTIGHTYLTRNNEQLVYMGRYYSYDYKGNRSKSKKYWFAKPCKTNFVFERYVSIPQTIISCVSEEISPKYSEYYEKMEYDYTFSPYDETKDEFIEFSYEEFETYVGDRGGYCNFISKYPFYNDSEYDGYRICKRPDDYEVLSLSYILRPRLILNSLKALFDKMKPMYRRMFLANGNEFRKSYNKSGWY